jgi:hypothetical protein
MGRFRTMLPCDYYTLPALSMFRESQERQWVAACRPFTRMHWHPLPSSIIHLSMAAIAVAMRRRILALPEKPTERPFARLRCVVSALRLHT